jgi:15-cis-phytoene synthase
MTVLDSAWERPLLSMAYGANHCPAAQPTVTEYDPELLNQAYHYCDSLTAVHSRSFHLSSGLLPAHKRRATRALYAFCRVTDDIVDRPQPGDDILQNLTAWRETALQTRPPEDELVAVAWSDARRRYQVPPIYAEQLIDGVAQDLQRARYETFDQLAAYSYGVASTVGLMSMHVIGFAGPEAIPYAIKLGVALQITNILRDVGADWQTGRLYLPLAELSAFGLCEEDIAAGTVTPCWRRFMQFQIERNRQLYEEAWPGIQMLDRDGRFAIAAAAGLYQAILGDIERHDYNVFTRRAYVSGWGKLAALPGLWRRSR